MGTSILLTAAEHMNNVLREENAKLKAANEILRKALEFYAIPTGGQYESMDGNTARKALKESRGITAIQMIEEALG